MCIHAHAERGSGGTPLSSEITQDLSGSAKMVLENEWGTVIIP